MSDLSQWEAIDGDEAEREAQKLTDSKERAKEIANVEPKDKFPSEGLGFTEELQGALNSAKPIARCCNLRFHRI